MDGLASSDDGGTWLHCRLAALEDRADALRATVSKQQAEHSRLVRAAAAARDDAQGFETKTALEAHAERRAAKELEHEVAVLASVRRQNVELGDERKRLLREIANRKDELGLHAMRATESKEVQAKCNQGLRKTGRRAERLLKSLRSLGDRQAQLVAEEAEEKRVRQEMRQSIRESLAAVAQHCSELEMRLAGRGAEMGAARARITAALELEKRSLEEAAELRREVRRCEGTEGPTHMAHRDELQHQLRVLTSVDADLREQLREARGRLFKKQQRQIEEGHNLCSAAGGA